MGAGAAAEALPGVIAALDYPAYGGRGLLDLDLSVPLSPQLTLNTGVENALNVFPEENDYAHLTAGNRYGQFSPFGFDGAGVYGRLHYAWGARTHERTRMTPAADRRLGTAAALGLTAMLTTAIGGTTAGGLWISANGLRAQAEEAGRAAAVTAATSFATLAEPSAANIARTLDIVLHDHLQAQAAATALLVEAAETAGHRAAYIEDALGQIAFRSPIRRIDITSTDGPSYSTERTPLGAAALEPAFGPLTTAPATGRTAAAAATETTAGLTKAAAAQPMHRPAAVRIEQQLDSLSAAAAYGGADDDTARGLAGQQAAAIARLITHALELAEEADWEAVRIDERLDALVRNTAIEHIAATIGNEHVAYEAGTPSDPTGNTTARLEAEADGAVALEGAYGESRRWMTRAAATRANSRLTTTVEVATRTREGTLVESAWQTEANRLASVEGITGVWITEITPAADGGDDVLRLAAAAPGFGQARPTGIDAWSRWELPAIQSAAKAARLPAPTARSSIELLTGSAASVVSTAPIGRTGATRAAVVIESRADAVVGRMRREAAAGLAAAAALIALLAMMTTWTARRWLTRPIEAMAEAAGHLQAGERPPDGLTASLQPRRDEIGGLARSFRLMTERVLARHDELTALVADKTRWLQEANRKLTETQQRIDAEIGLAKTVQQALVPQGTETAGNLTLCSRMTPARELGGDFIRIDRRPGGKLFVAVCDVSGKGVATALFMAVARSAIAAAASRHDNVREIAEDANRTLVTANPLGMFVTGVIALIDTATGRVDYVIAGHEPPLAVRPGRRVDRLERSGNIPLGVDPGEQYDKFEHRIELDETIVAYTDGVTDACNPSEEIFGEDRLQELVVGNALEFPEHMLQQIWTATDLFSGPMAAADDKTCVLIRRHA